MSPPVQAVTRAQSDVRTRHFRRSYLEANKVSKNEKTRKVEYAIISESVLMPFTKIIKIGPRLLKLQLAKIGAFFGTQCI